MAERYIWCYLCRDVHPTTDFENIAEEWFLTEEEVAIWRLCGPKALASLRDERGKRILLIG